MGWTERAPSPDLSQRTLNNMRQDSQKNFLKELMSLIGLTMLGGFFSSARVWRRIRHGHKEK